MSFGSPVETSKKHANRFQSFIVFEQSSSRISEGDVLLRGEDILPFFEELFLKIQENDDLKTQILINKFSKIQQMLSLVNNIENIIVTRFFDRIWKRYSYVSNLGESFVDLETYLKHNEASDSDYETLIATRTDEYAQKLSELAAEENSEDGENESDNEDDDSNEVDDVEDPEDIDEDLEG